MSAGAITSNCVRFRRFETNTAEDKVSLKE